MATMRGPQCTRARKLPSCGRRRSAMSRPPRILIRDSTSGRWRTRSSARSPRLKCCSRPSIRKRTRSRRSIVSRWMSEAPRSMATRRSLRTISSALSMRRVRRTCRSSRLLLGDHVDVLTDVEAWEGLGPVQAFERAGDGASRGGDHLDAQTGAAVQVVHHPRHRGVVHGGHQRVGHAGQGHHTVLQREPLVDEPAQRRIDDDRVEVEEPDVELAAERQAQSLLGDHVQADQRGAERLAGPPLLGERGLELLLADLAALDEQVPQSGAAAMALEDGHELVAADQPLRDEDVPQRNVAIQVRLHPQGFVDLRPRDQPFVHQQLAKAKRHVPVGECRSM